MIEDYVSKHSGQAIDDAIDAVATKSTVTASSTGTSTTQAKYITIDSSEYKVGNDITLNGSSATDPSFYAPTTYGNRKLLVGRGSTSAVTYLSSTGTAGQVLTSNGSSSDPSWQTPSGSGYTYIINSQSKMDTMISDSSPGSKYNHILITTDVSATSMTTINISSKGISSITGLGQRNLTNYQLLINKNTNIYFVVRNINFIAPKNTSGIIYISNVSTPYVVLENCYIEQKAEVSGTKYLIYFLQSYTQLILVNCHISFTYRSSGGSSYSGTCYIFYSEGSGGTEYSRPRVSLINTSIGGTGYSSSYPCYIASQNVWDNRINLDNTSEIRSESNQKASPSSYAKSTYILTPIAYTGWGGGTSSTLNITSGGGEGVSTGGSGKKFSKAWTNYDTILLKEAGASSDEICYILLDTFQLKTALSDASSHSYGRVLLPMPGTGNCYMTLSSSSNSTTWILSTANYVWLYGIYGIEGYYRSNGTKSASISGGV